MSGYLISFEGIDFCGKSLQARLLYDHLLAMDLPAVFLREPGSTGISEKIRKIVLDKENDQMVHEAELLLYSAARTQMVHQEVIPFLRDGKIVICDRYYDSTTAYQGYGREIDLDFVGKLNKFVTKGTTPNLTFLIDLDPELAQTRNRKKGKSFDRLEKEDIEFHERVRAGYLEIAGISDNRERVVVVPGNRPAPEIQEEIQKHVLSRLHSSSSR